MPPEPARSPLIREAALNPKRKSFAPATRRAFLALLRFLIRHQWLTAALILGGAIATLVLWTLLLPLPEAHGAYSIQKSVRFNDDDSAYLSRTLTTPTDAKLWTFSTWLKRANLTVGALISASSDTTVGFNNDQLWVYHWNGSSYSFQLLTTPVFRDPSAWYHVVVAVDTTQATASDRVKIYVNGNQITSFGTASYPSQNATYAMNTAVAHRIGYRIDNVWLYDGYLSDVYLIDGQALDPTAFAETDATTGSWKAKAYSGTYGTNGFHFDFTDSSTLGNDVSGNGNDFTSNNLDATDQVRDTPTNNYATLSPVDRGAGASLVTANGNLAFGNSSAAANNIRSTFAVKTGKWYWEMRADTASSAFAPTGLDVLSNEGALTSNTSPSVIATLYICSCGSNFTQYLLNGVSQVVGTPGIGSIAINDIVQVAMDADTGKIWFGVNNVWMDGSGGTTGNPTTGANPTLTVATGYNLSPGIINFGGNYSGTFNFGQGGQTGLTYYSAAGGAFKYAPPQGYKALSTSNLPAPAIAKPSNFFDAKTYTGNGSTQSITGLNFQPALTWIKRRSASEHHWLTDAVRGVTKGLYSNLTDAEATRTDQIQSFNADGFSLGADAAGYTNVSGQTYISWNWKESATAGLDIVTYTGDGTTNRTVNHSLGDIPDFFIIKDRTTATTNWMVHHKDLGDQGTYLYYLQIDTAAKQASATLFPKANLTTTVFPTSGSSNNTNVNASGDNYIAYLFAEIPGFSKFGSYTGNGSADGPFVYTGFKPRWVMMKKSSGVYDWVVLDTARDTYNLASRLLYPNLTNVDTSSGAIDILSNGFKIRRTDAINDSGGTYIYAAFAESPFKYASAGATGPADYFIAWEF